MTHARLLALVLAFAVPGAPVAAGPTKPACARELALTETSLLKTLVRMQSVGKASPSERCETYRAHAAVVAKARDVFERCSTGAARSQDLGDMDGALDRVKTAIASACATP
ncbi:MAG TPA: hypothetical protein VGX95_08515 [Xanthobacteraceae bacterium]|jgi:hypothetical protein|nr:hypothetical protein [Xanthobacteraceae bacterium]